MRLTTSSKNKIVAIVVGTIVVFALLAIITTRGCVGNNDMEERAERFDTTGIENVSIDFPAGKLIVRETTTNENDVMVIERVSGNMANKGETTCSIENGTLTVGYKTNPLAWLPIYWFGFGNRELEIVLPAEIFKSLKEFTLHCAAGECDVGNLQCNSANVNVSAGNVALNGIVVTGHADLGLSAGNLNIRDAELGTCKLNVSAGKAELNADMTSLSATVSAGKADITCTNSDIENIDVDLSAGAVELQLPKDAGFDAAVDKSAGSFNCVFEATVRGETYKYGDGRTPIEIHIAAGSMTLKPL